MGIDEQWWKKASNVDTASEVYRARKGRRKKSGNRDLSDDMDHSGVQLAMPTQSGQSGLTSTTLVRSLDGTTMSPMEDDMEEPDSDIREQQERELAKKTSLQVYFIILI